MVFEGLLDFITLNYRGKIVEVGSGSFFEIALELKKRGFNVTCVDIRDIKPPKGVKFFIDDIINPNFEIYENSSLIYSIRPPYELFKAIHSLSRRVGADCIIKPLHNEIPEGFSLVNYKGDFFYLSRSLDCQVGNKLKTSTECYEEKRLL